MVAALPLGLCWPAGAPCCVPAEQAWALPHSTDAARCGALGCAGQRKRLRHLCRPWLWPSRVIGVRQTDEFGWLEKCLMNVQLPSGICAFNNVPRLAHNICIPSHSLDEVYGRNSPCLQCLLPSFKDYCSR